MPAHGFRKCLAPARAASERSDRIALVVISGNLFEDLGDQLPPSLTKHIVAPIFPFEEFLGDAHDAPLNGQNYICTPAPVVRLQRTPTGARNAVYQVGEHRFLMQGKSEGMRDLTNRLRVHTFCPSFRRNTEGVGVLRGRSARDVAAVQGGRFSPNVRQPGRSELIPSQFTCRRGWRWGYRPCAGS